MYRIRSLENLSLYICICSLAGAFGKVFEGVLNDPDKNMVEVSVAIKTIKSMHTVPDHYV